MSPIITQITSFIYAVSGFVAVIVMWINPFKLPISAEHSIRSKSNWLALISKFGLFLLAFGTGCDNARTFAGLYL